MKASIYIFSSLLLACFTVCSSANAENTIQHQSKKVYVNSQDVQVTKDGILISTDKGLVKVKSLRSDKNGYIYISERGMNIVAEKGTYRCPYCPRICYDTWELSNHIRNSHRGR